MRAVKGIIWGSCAPPLFHAWSCCHNLTEFPFFIGVEKYQIIREQGNAFLDHGNILAKAFHEAELAAASLTEVGN
ncbi:MAG: hypothetical protein K0S39_2043 [Paenibacillus sp.]|jgi:hypothetical protein|nr:hypothetical protein [Paenibacillus sp.]